MIEPSKLKRIIALYGYAIKQGHVGRRTLMNEFELTRPEAESVLDEIRSKEEDADFVSEIIDFEGYDDTRDQYRFLVENFLGEQQVWSVSGERIRSMKTDYSAGFTIREVAINHDLPPSLFYSIKRLLDWTHADEPFTDEEALFTDPDDLSQEIVNRKRRAEVERKIQREEMRALKKSARKWERAEIELAQITQDLFNAFPDISKGILNSIPKVNRDENLPPCCTVANIQDSHLGKASFLGESDLERYSDSIVSEFAGGLDELSRLYAIEEIVMTLGGDTTDIDTAKGTTTSGRPMNISTSPQRILYEALRQQVRQVVIAKQYAKDVYLYFVPGNHDNLTGWAVAMAVFMAFRNDPQVHFTWSWHHRKYHRYSDHLFMLTHEISGDVKRHVGETFMQEASELVGQTKYYHVHTGHLHHGVHREDKQGVVRHYQGPAPIWNDEYHLWQWPNAKRQIQLVAYQPDSIQEHIIKRDIGKHYHTSPSVQTPTLPSIP